MLTKIMKGDAKIKINVIFSLPGLENNLFIPEACGYLSADSLALIGHPGFWYMGEVLVVSPSEAVIRK